MHAHRQESKIHSKILVLIDFDGTLCKIDSYSAFLKSVSSTHRFYWRCLPLLPHILSYYLGYYPAAELRPKLSYQILSQQSHTQISSSLPYYVRYILQQLNPQVEQRLKWHQQQDHDIYIVSAGLNVYLKPIADRLNVGLICSELAIDGEKFTGMYSTPDCSGEEKVKRVKSTVNLSEFDFIYAYGNSDEDYAMLALADSAWWVEKDQLQIFNPT